MMTLDTIYSQHRAAPTPATESDLFAAVRRFVAPIVSRRVRHDHEDIVSDIVIHAWKSIDTISDPSVPFSAWVRSIAKRRINEALRQRSRRPDLLGMDAMTIDAIPETDEDEVLIINADALACLTGAQRELLRRFVAQPDYESLAADIGISSATLRNRLQRIAKKKLTAAIR